MFVLKSFLVLFTKIGDGGEIGFTEGGQYRRAALSRHKPLGNALPNSAHRNALLARTGRLWRFLFMVFWRSDRFRRSFWLRLTLFLLSQHVLLGDPSAWAGAFEAAGIEPSLPD